MNLWPSKSQWNKWTLPSKLTAIGTLLGLIALIFYSFEKTYQFSSLILNYAHKIMSDGPHLVYSLQAAHNGYRPGLQVNGVIWQESYREYYFSIGNPSETASVIDLRLEYQLPWTLINLQFARQDECEGLAFEDNGLRAVRGVGDRVIEILPARTNVVLISASKLFPEALCNGKLVLNTTLPDGLPLQHGNLRVSYRYLEADGRETKNSRFAHFFGGFQHLTKM